MTDYTIKVKARGDRWAWSVDMDTNSVAGSSRRITDVEDDARMAILQVLIEAKDPLRFSGFTTDVELANPYVPKVGEGVIVCDIDGTLAMRWNRGPYEFDKIEDDLVNGPVYEYLEMAYPKFRIVLLSGRQEEYREQTERWLEKHLIPFHHLYMRPEGDRRSDDIVKLELFDTFVRDRFFVSLVLDDRDRCVYLWRKLGLPCWQVAFGDF